MQKLAAGEDVLLDEIRGADVALEQAVVDDDALDAGPAAGLEQAVHRLEVGGPVFAAHGLDHLDGADGVIRAVVDVAVILQPQVGLVVRTHARHALARKGQLFGGQRDAGDMGVEFGGGLLGQRAPATADLQHPGIWLHTGHAQRAPHFGVLGSAHVAACIALEPGGRVVHRVVQPEFVERVAQVVVGVDVLLAVGAGVAVEQVLDAVQKAAGPGAVDHAFHLLAVGDEEL
eukprot:gene18506-26124_t